MPRGACRGSELRGGGGRRAGRRAAQQWFTRKAGAWPSSRRVWPRWLFCAAAAHRGGGRVSSPPQPTPAPVPGPARPVPTSICQQVLSSVHQLPSCPLRVWIPRSGCFRTCRVRRGGTRDTRWSVRGGGRQGLGTPTDSTKALSTSWVLGTVLGLGEGWGAGQLRSLAPGSLPSSRTEAGGPCTQSLGTTVNFSSFTGNGKWGQSHEEGTREPQDCNRRVCAVVIHGLRGFKLLRPSCQSSGGHELGEGAREKGSQSRTGGR